MSNLLFLLRPRDFFSIVIPQAPNIVTPDFPPIASSVFTSPFINEGGTGDRGEI